VGLTICEIPVQEFLFVFVVLNSLHTSVMEPFSLQHIHYINKLADLLSSLLHQVRRPPRFFVSITFVDSQRTNFFLLMSEWGCSGRAAEEGSEGKVSHRRMDGQMEGDAKDFDGAERSYFAEGWNGCGFGLPDASSNRYR
jgi:hypothetical protein